MSFRSTLRAVTPDPVRIGVARARRALRDGGAGRFAAHGSPDPGFDHLVCDIVQPIRNTGFVEGKLANIRLGAARLDGLVVAPGETFSFWRIVGRPTARAGFEIGRSIRGGAVGGDIGGGLCQLSGIAYEAGLRAGLRIAERWPHSRDLYSEAERFTPLGLDATVVWPYKDLRLANPHDVPVRLGFAVEDMILRACVHAPTPVAPAELEIARTDGDGVRAVRVLRDSAPVSDDLYLFG